MKIVITTNETEVNYSIQANNKELKVFSDNMYYLEHLVDQLNKGLCQPPPAPTPADPIPPLHAGVIANENL